MTQESTPHHIIPPSEETTPPPSPPPVLPTPDIDNITVLSSKLPDAPILPWNHYDSPQKESEHRETPVDPPKEESTKSDDDANHVD